MTVHWVWALGGMGDSTMMLDPRGPPERTKEKKGDPKAAPQKERKKGGTEEHPDPRRKKRKGDPEAAPQKERKKGMGDPNAHRPHRRKDI